MKIELIKEAVALPTAKRTHHSLSYTPCRKASSNWRNKCACGCYHLGEILPQVLCRILNRTPGIASGLRKSSGG